MSIADFASANPGSAAPTAAGRSQERVSRILHGGEMGGFRAISDVAGCLMPLLSALGWYGDHRHLSEALPHFADTLDIEDLRAVLANLNYTTQSHRLRLRDLDPRLTPCLFLPDGGPAMVVLGGEAGKLTVFNGETSTIAEIDPRKLRGTAYFVAEEDTASDSQQLAVGSSKWIQSVARRFRGLVLQMLGVTFVTSALALAVPLFTMTVYDRVISSRSEEMLLYLVGGVAFALAADMGLRVVRARILAYIGARIDMILGAAAFKQILHLPIVMTERASIGAQLSRIKQFEAVREFFTGPLAGVFLELPFVLVFVAVIAVIAGPLAWIPVVLIVVFVLAGLLVVPAMRRAVAASGENRAQRQGLLIETLSHFRAIKASAAEPVWCDRFRDVSARTAISNFHTTQVSVFVQTLAQTLMLTAGIATIGLGTLRVLDGSMTIGALVACMALIWRVLSPLQVGFLSMTRLEQVKLGLRQLNQLMSLKPEREPGKVAGQHRTFQGEVVFSRVSLRYAPNAEPALLGVELEIKPGEIVAITGPSSSGKSSLLKLAAGLYQAQAGAVLIDGIDIRQLDMGELRNAIAFVPQTCHLFHGTIAQNLRLSNPTATDAALSQAVLDAGLLEEILALPEGMETRLTDQLQRQLPLGFKQRLMLARAYVKDAPIYLMDEPAANLDDEGDTALRRKLQQLRGRATVLVITHRPSHMRLADRVVYLNGGRLIAAGTPDVILPKLQSA